MSNQKFYQNILRVTVPLNEVVGDARFFYDVPEDWSVIIADVKDSTLAVLNGLHNEVNLASTGSIAAVFNTVQEQLLNYKIPYFFGGDGVTFLTPEEIQEIVLQALERHAEHVLATFDLVLRTGSMSVSEITATGRTVRICKYKINNYLTIPIVLGTGLKYAEAKIKKDFKTNVPNTIEKMPLNLDGMECRWDEVIPEQKNSKVVCLLVVCDDEKEQHHIYENVISEIDTIFGDLEKRKPITTPRLKLDATIAKIRKEMYARIGKYSAVYLLKNWLVTCFGVLYFKYFEDGKQYVFKMSQLSDTIMIDGTLNTVMNGTSAQIDKLRLFLDEMEQKGKLQYGIHVTYASVMSCYIQDRKENHIHFVDGTEGGYTAASLAFKTKSFQG